MYLSVGMPSENPNHCAQIISGTFVIVANKRRQAVFGNLARNLALWTSQFGRQSKDNGHHQRSTQTVIAASSFKSPIALTCYLCPQIISHSLHIVLLQPSTAKLCSLLHSSREFSSSWIPFDEQIVYKTIINFIYYCWLTLACEATVSLSDLWCNWTCHFIEKHCILVVACCLVALLTLLSVSHVWHSMIIL